MKRKTKGFEDKAVRPAEDKATESGPAMPRAGTRDMLVIRMHAGRSALIDGVRREAGETVTAPRGVAEGLIAHGYAEYIGEA